MALPRFARNRFPNRTNELFDFLNWVNSVGRVAEVSGTAAQRRKLALDYRVAKTTLLDWTTPDGQVARR